MKCAVVYSSHTGNTEMLAKEARKILEGQECLYYGIPDEKAKKAAEEAELVFAGFWTDKGNCEEQMAEFLELSLIHIFPGSGSTARGCVPLWLHCGRSGPGSDNRRPLPHPLDSPAVLI